MNLHEEVRAGAIVQVTLAAGQVRWDGEICDVLSMHMVHGVLSARCASVFTPSVEALVPVNEAAMELLMRPPSQETAGGEPRVAD